MEPILANTNLDNQFIFSLFVSNELIVLESVNQMSRLCELSLTECCHQLLKLREFIGLTGTRQRAIQSRIVIDMNKEDIIHMLPFHQFTARFVCIECSESKIFSP